ncbi:MAG: hypothetical protein KatS3mg109_0532 [Pirellulaceae bacterium]|nr:MAG: hypothetical protein KatS3mg109_0532 [Pirellulaceae bacterium]GIW94719.1 MAG: hypothetical protein KatS3mg110_2760 [Pirellulaceae bacterium]
MLPLTHVEPWRRAMFGLVIVALTGVGQSDRRETACRGAQPENSDAQPLPVRRLPRDQLLVYLDDKGQARSIASAKEWPLRRNQILLAMQSIMGQLPVGEEKRCPLDIAVHEEEDCGQYVRRLISYQSEPGSRVPAFLLVPKPVLEGPQRKAPAVLALHPTDHQIGHRVVVGLGGRPNRQYASELAERGFVVLAPSYPLLADYQPDIRELGWESGTLKAIWDNMRGLDLLESLPYVKQGGFGAIGHSLGGHNAVFTAAFDTRIVATVSSCGLDSFLDYYGGDPMRWLPEQGWAQTRYMPRMAQYRERLEEIPFDFHEVVAAIAPRRLLLIAPLHDHNFRADSVDRIVQAARPVYQLLGAGDHLECEHPDCDHDFPPAMRDRAYRFLAKALCEVKESEGR